MHASSYHLAEAVPTLEILVHTICKRSSFIGSRYGNEMDSHGTLEMLVGHVRAGKVAQARMLHSMPQGMELPGVELKHMLDLCLYFIPAHRLKVQMPADLALEKHHAVWIIMNRGCR